MGAVAPLGVATIAPHTFIEDVCIDGIRSIDTQSERVIRGLARHHDDPRLAFERWRNVWLTAEFRDWDITALLGKIACPILVLQGDGDQYGTKAQVTTIVELVPNATGHILADCGHVAHRDQPDLIADYLADVRLGVRCALSGGRHRGERVVGDEVGCFHRPEVTQPVIRDQAGNSAAPRGPERRCR